MVSREEVRHSQTEDVRRGDGLEKTDDAESSAKRAEQRLAVHGREREEMRGGKRR